MTQKIKNALLIECEDINLTKVTALEFYIRQSGKTFQPYHPQVIDAHRMVVVIPYEDAMQLRVTKVEMQFAFVDEDGNPRPSDIVTKPVRELLKEAGYDPL